MQMKVPEFDMNKTIICVKIWALSELSGSDCPQIKKSTGFVPFWANLTHFVSKSDTPVRENYKNYERR